MPLTQTARARAATPYDRAQAASLQMHGRDWDGCCLTGWVVTEKMDGCRAYWDGRTLYTKSGCVINAPAITARLPQGMHLDGEIWAGRGGYEMARRFVQYGQHADKVAFVAFDAPQAAGGKAQRLDAAKRAGVRCAAHRIVRSMSALREQLQKAIAGGAEGLMACRPDAPYRAGRGDALVKLKQHSLELFSEAPDPANDRHQPINPRPAPCGLFSWSFKKMPLTQNPHRPRNTFDVMHAACWALSAAIAIAIALSASALFDGPTDAQAAQDVADEAAYAAATADGGAAQCAALGRKPLWTPGGDLICRLPARRDAPAQAVTVAQAGQP